MSENENLDEMREKEEIEEKNYFPSQDKKKSYFSWSMYDWANSVYGTTVMTGFFPAFLSYYWTLGTTANATVILGYGTSFAYLIVAIMAPILGAISDKMSGKKKFLMFFAFLGMVMTVTLFFAGEGMWLMAIILYSIANVGYASSNMFYNSLLPAVASQKKVNYVSSLGYSLGYIGGAILFTVNIIMYMMMPDSALAVKLSFITVAIWWGVFTIPLLLYVKEPAVKAGMTVKKAIKSGLGQLKKTFADVRALKVVALFLVAYWLYLDGVNTIITMAVSYGTEVFKGLGLSSTTITTYLMIAILITQIVAFPAVMLYNIFARKIGTKNSILVAIAAYSIITFFGYLMTQIWQFFALAIAIGFFQGGIQALSRSFYSRLIPRKKSGEFYGFLSLIGKFAAIIGPFLMAFVQSMTGSPRLSILSIIILFVAGGILLLFVNVKKGEEMALKYLA